MLLRMYLRWCERAGLEAEVVDLLIEEDHVAGVTAKTPRGPLEIRAPVTIGADGRDSVVRERARLRVEELGVPIDVLCMRLSRRADDPGQTFGYLRSGHVLVMLDRGDYWQCAFVIPKGGYDELRRRGLPSLRDTIAAMVPFLRDRVGELADWDNLAVQDAVAAANRLFEPLRRGSVTIDDLRSVQRRRKFPTRATQRVQMLIQDRVIGRVLGGGAFPKLPLAARLLRDHPILRRIPARMIGVGFRPEHVRTPDAFPGGGAG